MARTHLVEIIDNSGDAPRVMATYWLEDGKVACDSGVVDAHVRRGRMIGGVTPELGIGYLAALPSFYGSGYLAARRVRETWPEADFVKPWEAWMPWAGAVEALRAMGKGRP